jgi:hypothetical protein
MVWDGSEKRKFPRVVFPCRLAVGSPLRWLTSHTENISEGGIRVILEEKLRVLALVSLELFFEKDKSIKCRGRVVWVEEEVNPIDKESEPIGYVTGIEITEISDNDREYIKKLVRVVSMLKKKEEDLKKDKLHRP